MKTLDNVFGLRVFLPETERASRVAVRLGLGFRNDSLDGEHSTVHGASESGHL